MSPSEWARADRLARRLHAELCALMSSLPAAARHASGLARHLGIDRTTCQRTVYVTNRPCPGPEMFERLPGVRGLRQLVEAAARARPAAPAAVVDAAAAALDQYQELIVALGGSQARLARRVALGRGADPHETADDDAAEQRVRLFDAAAEITGRASDCWTAVYAYRPSPTDPQTVDVFRANGLIGHVARPDAVPLVVHNFSSASEEAPEHFASLENAPVEGSSPTVVLEDFTTDPPPLVTARQPHEFLVQAIDPRPTASSAPVDLMLASRTSLAHPALGAPPMEEVWALVNFPCRHLLFDVYLHRDLARASLASLDTHLWGPDFTQQVGDRWQTRFSESPPLQLLGPGIRRSSPAAYPRMTELTGELFARSGLDPEEYVGYRCDVAYPIWRGGYCIRFDFARASGEG